MKHKTHFSGLFLLLFLINIPCTNYAQSNGDADTIAINSDHPTNFQDGSSFQKKIRYKPRLIARLPLSLSETSGLVFIGGQLWTINDSGNPAEVYQVDTITGIVLRKVVIRNSMNTDWEGITQDDSNVYIGDFGNNSGNRTTLNILKISKIHLLDKAYDTVKASYIYFSYPDQIYPDTSFNKTNFDCEAFFYHNDSLHLFSKNWSDLKTKHYVVPSDKGIYKARLAEQFNADGLITDASINDEGNIALLGYKNTGGKFYSCFVWMLSGYEGCLYFSGKKIRIDLGSAIHLGQTEGIVLKNDNSGWFSSESILAGRLNQPAKLFYYDFSGITEQFTPKR